MREVDARLARGWGAWIAGGALIVAASDVLIVGAGLVGSALALALQGAGLRVVLLDRAPIAEPGPAETWDERIFAISPGSAEFLHALGVWGALPVERLQAVEAMRIRGDRPGRPLEFDAYELAIRALAWILEQRSLHTALVARLRETEGAGDGLSLRGGEGLQALHIDQDGVKLRLDSGEILEARLLVGADGLHSWVRRATAIAGPPQAYGHSAVVANFECERPHLGRAWQWFLPNGAVLALLPLPGRAVSMVWSAPAAEASALTRAEPQELAARVAQTSGQELGALRALNRSACYPLYFLRLNEPIGQRLALVGDAAHGMHPLAGQGVNLGFGDAACLAEVLHARGDSGDCGASWLLARYARARAVPVQGMQFLTHNLWRLFQQNDGITRALRNLGLTAVAGLPLVRRMLAQPALR
ncbi:MAG: FAD-dependent monooxygenase [Betaproteobacteria bacterium]|nr:FAD-dependent monooxygenase [Betaproteobacteria bacterium]